MGDATRVEVAEMEALVTRLPGVERCYIAVNDWGAIEEIHILATVERSPKQIVRDVESALLAQWGIRVDRRVISVAQVADGPQVRPGGRLTIAEFRLDLDAIGGTATARVVLQPADDDTVQYVGEWRGRYLPSHHLRPVAAATVEALNQIPTVREALALADLQQVQLANRPVVVAAVSYLNPRRREEVLVGAVAERGDGLGAAVRAVLDAVNRRLGAGFGAEPAPARG
ncbi:MAG: hypothetical protein K6U14_03530 [Firmicutes bacterium]|nr:hypothetical protein [Alicyclobacillaceae bacterium]MCL6496691.1 hypothetical protein [Bacillota bacterium]